MARDDNLSIVYPPGCRTVSEELGSDEMVRRLKTLADTLQSLGQDDGAYQEYIPLAMHIADEFFLTYPSRDVQLLVACCIADILRVYAPEAPYKDPNQVKTIFMFLIKQLGGLKDPKDPAFKRYFYLLENLAYVKSFNMCFELEQSQEIFCKLFKLMFGILNDEHSVKVKSFMLDVLCPLINESDVVSNELLNIILSNILEPAKKRKHTYELARDLVVKCADTLEPYIQAFFNHTLILGKEEKTLTISLKVYDLIYELNHICPSILLAILPQLEFKLKSTAEDERYQSVSLLAKMFSEKESTLAMNHKQLWSAFLGRFNDISVKIRMKCVQYSMHFLLNHLSLRKDISDTLKLRQHDSEECVRYEVVMAIVSTAKRDFNIVSESEDLLHFVRERTLDKKFKIRKEAMCGLAMIYKRLMSNPDVSPATKHAVCWIKDKILHGYYMTSTDDRLLVERLLNTCLVPYQLSPEERMKKLFHLYATMDENASKAFIELQKHQLAVRKSMAEVMEYHIVPEDETDEAKSEREKEISMRINQLSKFLPDSLKAVRYLQKLSQDLSNDKDMFNSMETVLSPDVSCKESVEAVTCILKKFGTPGLTNIYYNTGKMLMERVSNVMIDHAALDVLVELVTDSLDPTSSLLEELQLESYIAVEKGLKLLFVLSFVYPAHFMHKSILEKLITLLKSESESTAPTVLSTLSYIGKYKAIGTVFPDIAKELGPICQKFAETGTPKQAKQSVRCLFVNLPEASTEYFSAILNKIKENLTFESKSFRTSVVTLGHIALNMPEQFAINIKTIISRKIVRELLMKNQTSDHTPGPSSTDDDQWCDEDDLCEETKVKIEAIKMMARWLLGLKGQKDDVISAQKTFRMLDVFIRHKGDIYQTNKMIKAEMSYLRLAAGAAMLKICEKKGVGDQFTAEQFYNLSHLMIDECEQVREKFAMKVHKGLGRGIPQKCLPLDFMGFYCLAGLEKEKNLKLAVRQYMIADINKRRDFIKSYSGTGGDKVSSQLPHIMPDFMLVFSVPVLSHLPLFTNVKDVEQLKILKTCLWFVLEALITKNESYCFGFYKALIEKMKNHKDAAKVKPEDEIQNCHKLWAVCDLAMTLIFSKSSNFEMRNFPADPLIPPMYFKKHDDLTFVNDKCYLPAELQVSAPKKSTKLAQPVKKKDTITDESSVIQESFEKASIDLPHDFPMEIKDSENESRKRSIDSSVDSDDPLPKKPKTVTSQNNNKHV